MKIRSATFFMSRGAERKWQRTICSIVLTTMLSFCKEAKNALVKFITKANHKSSHFLSFWWIRVISIAMLLTDTTI